MSTNQESVSIQNDLEALDVKLKSLAKLHDANIDLQSELQRCRQNEQLCTSIRKESMTQLQYWRERGRLITAKVNFLETLQKYPLQTSHMVCVNSCGATFSNESNLQDHGKICCQEEPSKKVKIDESLNSVLLINANQDRKKRRRVSNPESALDGTYWSTR